MKESWGLGNILLPIYDNEDSVCGLIFNGTRYYFVKNLQGDVIAITNADAEVVARYTYDAWGKVLSATGASIANINPFRYRGYYYDAETGLYYLQSRYYDPNVGRFINADDTVFIQPYFSISTNLFAYCQNNAINQVDLIGFFGTPLQWACAAIGGIAGWLFGDYVARSIGLSPGKWWKLKTIAYWAVRGLVVVGGSILGWIAGTALLKILTKYLLVNPSIASKLPRIVLWFLGMGGPTGQIANEIFSKYGNHMFEIKHNLDGLVLKLGQRGLFNKAFEIVSLKITQAQNGSNQIFAIINGVKVTIRFWFYDGKFGAFNIIGGWVSRTIGKLLK